MNREIIFRGKRVDNNEWVYGDLIQLHDGRKYIIDNKFGACLDEKGNFINTESPFVNEVIPKTIGQYTNLKDKNKVMIFEGDLVKSTGMKEPYVVKFSEDRGGWFPFACGDGCGCCESETEPTWCMTVVGNETDGITNDIKEEPKKVSMMDYKDWISYKADKDRIEGIPLEDEDDR